MREPNPKKLLRAVVARLLGRRPPERQPGELDRPRPLTANEREALNFLLGSHFPGVEELGTLPVAKGPRVGRMFVRPCPALTLGEACG